jgi:inorganic pyrophosphatase
MLHATGSAMLLTNLPAFDEHGNVHVVVESPRGSSLKLKYDLERGVFGLSRPLTAGLRYPYDWGFVPSTHGPDGDPIDAMLIWDETSFPGLLLACRLVGVLEVEQNSERHPGTRHRNDRLIAVPVKAPRCERIRDVTDLAPRLREELASFFLSTTTFEAKDLRILSWSDASAALALVKRHHTA